MREVIASVERVTGQNGARTSSDPRRDGDPAILFASSERIRRELGWQPQFEDLDVIVETAWRWRESHPHGYGDRGQALMSRLLGQLADPLLSVVMPVLQRAGHDRGDHPPRPGGADPDRAHRRRRRIEGRHARHPADAGASELPFKLIFQPANGGKGAALRRGFEEVTGDLVVIQDADLEYSPEEFPQLIELICQGRADVVYGSRFLGRHRVFMFTHYAGNRLPDARHQRALQHDADATWRPATR